MARYQIRLAYDGSNFAGSQRQANARSVQSELEIALQRIGWQGSSVLISGRTDTGVHASGQVAAFDFEWAHPLDELLRAMNANLPIDMSVMEIREVNSAFHPRFDAIARQYRYHLFCAPVRDPLRERFAWRVWPPVQYEALQVAADLLIGTHDFAAFGSSPKPGGSTIRTVTVAEWKSNVDEFFFEVRANAFLYHMVRKMVFVQVAVGQGKLTAESITDALDGRPRVLPGGIAPAHGLTLVEVSYPENLEKNSSQ